MLNTLFLKTENPMDFFEYDIMDAIDLLDNCKQEKLTKKDEEEYLFDKEELVEQQFRLLPGALEDSQITYIDDELDMIQQNIPEDAVCFEDEKMPDLSDVFTNSQANPLLPSAISHSQPLPLHSGISELLNEEPFVPEFDDCSSTDCHVMTTPVTSTPSFNVQKPTVLLIDNNSYETTTSAHFPNLKRHASNISNNKEKRRKLCLNINEIQPNAIDNSLNTPDIVNLITEMRDEAVYLNFAQNSPDEVLNELLFDASSNNNSMHSFDNTTIPEDCPETPLSNYSVSHNTSGGSDYALTAPNSPAFSISSNNTILQSSSNSNQETPNRKKRGRPAKLHSDLPSPSLLKKLTEAERKRLEDRAKNNEASRLSRQKNKQREVEEIEEENMLQSRHEYLQQQLAIKEKIVRKLEQALQKKYLET